MHIAQQREYSTLCDTLRTSQIVSLVFLRNVTSFENKYLNSSKNSENVKFRTLKTFIILKLLKAKINIYASWQ